MEIILDSNLKDYTDHKFIDELQYEVNQVLAEERIENVVTSTSIGIISIEKRGDVIYVKKQD